MNEFNERDLFAALAMCGMLAHHGVLYNEKLKTKDDASGARRAYDIANAMMAEKEMRDAGISAY